MSGTDLYRFYDADGTLLYVGISLHAAKRASEHRKTQPWWPLVARMEVEHLPVDRAEALDIERRAIIDEKPLHNVAHGNATSQAIGLFVWTCDHCCLPIADGDGYLQVSQAEARRVIRDNAAMIRDRETITDGFRLLKGGDLFDLEDDAEWMAFHRACDPDVGSSHYWIAVERIRTLSQLLDWNDHLMSKGWASDGTDWTRFIADRLGNGRGHA